jgi:hypothetical protein
VSTHGPLRLVSADSWRAIQAAFAGVPRAQRELMLAGNACRLYGFGRR